MAEVDPRRASDYDDRTTVAVKSVLVEIGQVLGSYRGKFAVIGGAVPWLLLNQSDTPHIGTLDVDLALDADALGDGEYAQLVDSLLRQGYRQGEPLRRFQLKRTVPARDRGPDIDIIVDFLRPHDAPIAKNTPPLVADFVVQRADAAPTVCLAGWDRLPAFQNPAVVRSQAWTESPGIARSTRP